MAKWNPMALKLLMWVMGVLIVMGSGLGFIGGSFFPFDNWAGVSASVAGVAFGAGIMIAGFDPVANVSWVRALVGDRVETVPFIIAILVAVLVLVLYPNKPALWMQGTKMGGARA